MPNVVIFTDGRYGFTKPLGAYKIANTLRNNGYSTQVLSYFSHPSFPFKEFTNQFIGRDTSLICISATTMERQIENKFSRDSGNNNFGIKGSRFVERIKHLKAMAPNAIIAVGGGQFSQSNLGKFWELNGIVDFVCIGQGEEMILHLAKYSQDRTHPIKTKKSVYGFTTISDSDYPYNLFTLDPMLWNDSDGILPHEPLGLELSRGCIFQCGFCNYQLTGKKPGDYIKSYDTIHTEVMYNYEKYGTTNYVIVDDLLNDGWHKIELLEQLKEKTALDLKFVSYLRLDYFLKDNGMAKRLKDLGLIGCKFGIETIDKESGKSVGKGLGETNINKCFEHLAKYWDNIQAYGLFIMGLPYANTQYISAFEKWLDNDLTKQVLKGIHCNALDIRYGFGSVMGESPESYGYEILTDGDWRLNGLPKQFFADESKRLTTHYNSQFMYQPFLQPFAIPTTAFVLEKNIDMLVKDVCIITDEKIDIRAEKNAKIDQNIEKYFNLLRKM